MRVHGRLLSFAFHSHPCSYRPHDNVIEWAGKWDKNGPGKTSQNDDATTRSMLSERSRLSRLPLSVNIWFIHAFAPPSLLIRSSLNRNPLTLKYREEGKMQVGAATHGDNLMEMPAPFPWIRPEKPSESAYRKPERALWRDRNSLQTRRE